MNRLQANGVFWCFLAVMNWITSFNSEVECIKTQAFLASVVFLVLGIIALNMGVSKK